MNSQGVEEIIAQVEKAQTPHKLDIHNGLRLVTYNGEQKEYELPVPTRTVQATDLDSFAKAAAFYECHEIWLAQDKFVALPVQRSHYECRVIFQPVLTPVFALIAKQVTFNQETLILNLRTVLRNAVSPEGLLAAVRNVKVVNTSTMTSEQQAAASKMGREITAEATGAAKIPEDLLVFTKVFEDWADDQEQTQFDLVFTVETSQPPKFTLTPVGEQITRAIRKSLELAEKHIAGVDEAFSIFRGSPR